MFKFQISHLRLHIRKNSASICVYLWFISLGLFVFPLKNKAQVKPVYDYGAIGLGQILKRLNNTKSVMHIGAHPDDEDSGLLAFLARGENARTAYLSLTRGDGGQNIIGSELAESLGVIRTEELLQARRLDGAEQFFTRAYDYGFSKTLAEAKQKWDENIILCDTVRAIRTFRPLVVISRFSGTPADGHGQHQFAGYIAPLAVKAAADSNQCQESGAAWQVLKFYVSPGFRSTAEPTLKINTGEYDFLLGRSYFEIAMEGRSQHKTQEQGILELRGERFSGLNLIESKVAKVENERSVFDGIDVSLTAMSKYFDAIKFDWEKIKLSAERALQEYEPHNPQKIVPILIEGYKLTDIERHPARLTAVSSDKFSRFLAGAEALILKQKNQEFAEAVRLASGVFVDALADRETVAPGENFQTAVRVFFPNRQNVKVGEIALKAPPGWTTRKTSEPKETNQGFFRREAANESAYFEVSVSPKTKLTQPYWLEKERDGYLYAWEKVGHQNLSFEPSLLRAEVGIEIGGTTIVFSPPVEYRFADDVRGEIRRHINVVPPVSLSLDQKLVVVPGSAKKQTRKLILSVTNHKSSNVRGSVGLNVPENWQARLVSPDEFELKRKGQKAAFEFIVTIPDGAKFSDYVITAIANTDGDFYNQEMNVIAHPHIQTHRFYTDAKTKITVLDLKTAPAKIGYIMGSGDEIPEAIRQMGLSVELLNELDLTSGNLSRFQTIVVGIRAFQVRTDLISNNQRLLDYVKNGGNLIVQYQRPNYETLLPFPAKLGARVADENAKVTILDTTNPVFNFPNKITEKDFEGWVQERNLYAFSTFDTNYKPLLEAHDAGEAENKGGLVVANIGKGKYVYCSYAFFRQLPAGVPGAYRLFANLLALK